MNIILKSLLVVVLMVLSGLVSWCQRADSCNGWSVRDKGGVGRNYDHNRKFFLQRKKEKQWRRRLERSEKNVFSQCSGEGKATIPFLRTNVISEKNTDTPPKTAKIHRILELSILHCSTFVW